MLISRVTEEEAGEDGPATHSQEYQTANELFEMMAKNHPFDYDGKVHYCNSYYIDY
jgi:hypothetical protein